MRSCLQFSLLYLKGLWKKCPEPAILDALNTFKTRKRSLTLFDCLNMFKCRDHIRDIIIVDKTLFQNLLQLKCADNSCFARFRFLNKVVCKIMEPVLFCIPNCFTKRCPVFVFASRQKHEVIVLTLWLSGQKRQILNSSFLSSIV